MAPARLSAPGSGRTSTRSGGRPSFNRRNRMNGETSSWGSNWTMGVESSRKRVGTSGLFHHHHLDRSFAVLQVDPDVVLVAVGGGNQTGPPQLEVSDGAPGEAPGH